MLENRAVDDILMEMLAVSGCLQSSSRSFLQFYSACSRSIVSGDSSFAERATFDASPTFFVGGTILLVLFMCLLDPYHLLMSFHKPLSPNPSLALPSPPLPTTPQKRSKMPGGS